MDKTLVSLIAISLLTLAALFLSFRKMQSGFGPFNLKVYGLTLVIGMTAIIALTDISSEKTTACFSIFAAIAGYLFGLKNEK